MKLPIMLRSTHNSEVNILKFEIDRHNDWYIDLMDEVTALRKINVEKQEKINIQDKVIDKLETKNCEVVMDKFSTKTKLKEAEKRIQELEFCLREAKKNNVELTQRLNIDREVKRQLTAIAEGEIETKLNRKNILELATLLG